MQTSGVPSALLDVFQFLNYHIHWAGTCFRFIFQVTDTPPRIAECLHFARASTQCFFFFQHFLFSVPIPWLQVPSASKNSAWYSGWIPRSVEPGGELVHAEWQAPVAKKDTSDVHGFSPARKKTKAKELVDRINWSSSSSEEEGSYQQLHAQCQWAASPWVQHGAQAASSSHAPPPRCGQHAEQQVCTAASTGQQRIPSNSACTFFAFLTVAPELRLRGQPRVLSAG